MSRIAHSVSEPCRIGVAVMDGELNGLPFGRGLDSGLYRIFHQAPGEAHVPAQLYPLSRKLDTDAARAAAAHVRRSVKHVGSETEIQAINHHGAQR